VQIDHVLATPDWQITATRIPAKGAANVSDHRPVVVHLRWKGG
jgi:endonuclease/exonuclease/phosphatase family metal-dependent hydrolase